jgi:hypothetical protein
MGYAGYPRITAPSVFLLGLLPSWYTQLPSLPSVSFFISFFFNFPFSISHFSLFSLDSLSPVPNGISISIPLLTFYNLPLSQLPSLAL